MGTVVEGKSVLVSVTPTIDTNIYASGDQLGTAAVELDIALDDTKGTAAILSVVVVDAGKQSSALNVLFFNEAPTITSSDNAALDISDAEMAAKYLGSVAVASADYVALNVNSAATVLNAGLLVQGIAGSKDLYIILQSQGTPTYASTTDLTVKIGILQD